MIPLWISVVGGGGAVMRFMVDGLIRSALGRKFPYGTLIINVSGSFLLGILTGVVLYRHGNPNTKLVLGTGFCGGFTTFSTASFEAARLIEEKRYAAVTFQALGNVSLSLAAAVFGLSLIGP